MMNGYRSAYLDTPILNLKKKHNKIYEYAYPKAPFFRKTVWCIRTCISEIKYNRGDSLICVQFYGN